MSHSDALGLPLPRPPPPLAQGHCLTSRKFAPAQDHTTIWRGTIRQVCRQIGQPVVLRAIRNFDAASLDVALFGEALEKSAFSRQIFGVAAKHSDMGTTGRCCASTRPATTPGPSALADRHFR
jgi:hypothetical protein